jgi:hypothetical protein
VNTSLRPVKEAAEAQKRVSGEKGEVKDLPDTRTEDDRYGKYRHSLCESTLSDQWVAEDADTAVFR